MTFWGGSRLATEAKNGKFVEPFDEGRIDCSAYELALGAEAYVTPRYGDKESANEKRRLDAAQVEEIGGTLRTKGGGTVTIPPGQFALLLTEEVVSLPANVMGFISLKLKPKFRGLINVSGFHVDPGFVGRLIFSVYNAGPSAIQFDRGDRLFQLWIADVSGSDLQSHKRTKSGYSNIPSELISRVSRERHSLQALSERVDELGQQVKLYSAVAAGVVTAVGLALAMARMGLFSTSAPEPAPVELPAKEIKHLQPTETPPSAEISESKEPATRSTPPRN